MGDPRDFDDSTPLHDVIASLLRLVLPRERHALIPQLTGVVGGYQGVVEHRGKRWGELTKPESDRVAHLVGVIAREVLGTARESQSTG